MAELLRTDRLLVRDWSVADAEEALRVYAPQDLTGWQGHPPRRVPTVIEMRAVLQDWVTEQQEMAVGTGRWAMVLLSRGELIGGITLLPMPVPEADVEIGYRLAPEYWGHGYATEAARALANWAFQHSLVEVFALVTPNNTRAAATARRIGMEWVGESDKYHGAHLEVYRLRPDDLTNPAAYPANLRQPSS
ncbi:MAG TPA: GNAT family N-acetyltransferase [Pseudonocardiaceae bacterium]|jgi:RimJ/RimL family protein N-acetyltransferase|nr:GNAT family N-acetyltransferase [Pseudonocardiaceae bacterium]